MINYVAEFLGTFVFLFVILKSGLLGSSVQPFLIALGLLMAIIMFGAISGGHFNPAVTTMMFVKGDVTGVTAIFYILAQILGGICAFYAANLLK